MSELLRGRGARHDRSRRDNVLPFRPRRRPAVRRLRLHPLRRLAPPLLWALAIVGSPLLVVGWIFHSPAFALTDLELDLAENGRVDQRWVRAALDPFLRGNLPRLELAWVAEALSRHPWIAGAELRKELPGRLVVRILERRAVALYRGADFCGVPLCYLDARGESIAPVTPASDSLDLTEDLFLITGALPGVGPRPALELAREIAAVAPPWAISLSEIEVLGERDFRVWSAALPFPLLVRAGTLESLNPFFEALRPQIFQRRDLVAAVDMRFARRIIVKPRKDEFKQEVLKKGVG